MKRGQIVRVFPGASYERLAKIISTDKSGQSLTVEWLDEDREPIGITGSINKDQAKAIRKEPTMATAKSINISFTKERETPGTHVFAEDGAKEEHSVGKLYIKKSAAAKLGDPETIKVTITGGK